MTRDEKLLDLVDSWRQFGSQIKIKAYMRCADELVTILDQPEPEPDEAMAERLLEAYFGSPSWSAFNEKARRDRIIAMTAALILARKQP